MTITIEPTLDTYTVRNHNGAPMGTIEKDGNYFWFYPKNDWTSGFSAYQMIEISKFLNKINGDNTYGT